MPDVFLNGTLLDRDDARISAFDAGLVHGVGLFETMAATFRDGEASVFRLGDHLERLATSAKDLALSTDLNTNALGEAVRRVVAARAAESGLERLRVRLTITGGDLNLLQAARGRPSKDGSPAGHDPTIIIDAQPATPYPQEMFERGVRVAAADTRANPFNPFEGHKTLNYWWRLRELQAAAARGGAEAIVFSITNHAVGGCVSNVFIVKDDKLLTPIARGEEKDGGIPSPVLPGVTRRAVFDAADAQGLTADTRMLSFEDLATADEVFLTNSSWGVLPVISLEDRTVATGEPGPITQSISQAIRDARS